MGEAQQEIGVCQLAPDRDADPVDIEPTETASTPEDPMDTAMAFQKEYQETLVGDWRHSEGHSVSIKMEGTRVVVENTKLHGPLRLKSLEFSDFCDREGRLHYFTLLGEVRHDRISWQNGSIWQRVHP